MNLLEQHTALYTDLDIEYAQEMSGPYGDLSVTDEEGICVASTNLGAKIGDTLFNGFWRPMVCFGTERFQNDFIRNSAWMTSPFIVYEDYLVYGELSPISRFLLERGYTATPVYSRVIDMRAPFETLRSGLRKSYRSLVNKQGNVRECSVAEVHAIHSLVRGRTRSERSWEIQEKMHTVCVADGDRAAVMFYAGPVWAYYACAAGDNGHAAVWTALNLLHERGVEFVEMGEQVYTPTLGAHPDEMYKAMHIASYKRGFGGVTKTRLLLTRD